MEYCKVLHYGGLLPYSQITEKSENPSSLFCLTLRDDEKKLYNIGTRLERMGGKEIYAAKVFLKKNLLLFVISFYF
jgi:hypothetical protein